MEEPISLSLLFNVFESGGGGIQSVPKKRSTSVDDKPTCIIAAAILLFTSYVGTCFSFSV